MFKRTLSLEIPAALWMSSNDRLHWAEKAKRTRCVRHLAFAAARAANFDELRLERASIEILVHRPRAGRADAANASPTVKAAIDGLTDARVWPDDSDDHITAVTYKASTPTGQRGRYALTITITEEKS